MKTMNAIMMEGDDEADEDIAGPNPAGSDAILNHHLWNRDKSNLTKRRPQIVVCKLLRKHRRRWDGASSEVRSCPETVRDTFQYQRLCIGQRWRLCRGRAPEHRPSSDSLGC